MEPFDKGMPEFTTVRTKRDKFLEKLHAKIAARTEEKRKEKEQQRQYYKEERAAQRREFFKRKREAQKLQREQRAPGDQEAPRY